MAGPRHAAATRDVGRGAAHHCAARASLKAMLANTPFNSAAKLLKQFDLIAGPTGTRLVMYECKKA